MHLYPAQGDRLKRNSWGIDKTASVTGYAIGVGNDNIRTTTMNLQSTFQKRAVELITSFKMTDADLRSLSWDCPEPVHPVASVADLDWNCLKSTRLTNIELVILIMRKS